MKAAWLAGSAAALVTLGVVAGLSVDGGAVDAPSAAPSASATSSAIPASTSAMSTSARPNGAAAGTSPAVQDVSSTPHTSPTHVAAVDSSGLAAAYSHDLGTLAKRSGVALVPIGGGTPVVLGQVTQDVAWSTIKVPITVAAARSGGWAGVRDDAQGAITVSDNDAAMRLWTGLGGGTRAAASVEEVLRESGDTTTQVEPEVTRAGFSPFGQTAWSTSAQATVMSRLACRADAADTLELMRHVVPEQRWGLGRFDEAPIKGGWGPLASGGYLVRQMGVIPTSDGQTAVALIVRAPGGFDAGTADLDRITTWLRAHSSTLPGGRCA